ncbi:Phosphocholine transferase AnkX [Legionella massiliensis]|uniref:Phosphocholine transferase AnkX n=1 Tax=Legionella massiliensis TaxID=1034943 RepID=A0A078KXG5_9GAMM|nr:Dot/Icm T4SS effector AnkN/AnkX/LegA8 [Legionella massiliensis]CDZ79105.1 Phosphocholine transferase AnkX [Legionella massiliensis]CEE14843.1 Phosphocholine transferase AnkX [Legionella massiliensis]
MAKLPGLAFLKAYPQEEIWRLFVDGRFWVKENGWHGYESREPGSLNAALESLCSSALEVEDDFELSVDFIKSIHRKCGRKVEELEDKSPGEPRTSEPVSFGIPASRASIKGIEEFLRLHFLIESGAGFGPGTAGIFAPKFEHDYFKDLKPEQIPELAKQIYDDMCEKGFSEASHFFVAVRQNVEVYLEAITQSYNSEIKEAQTIDQKLLVIAKHIRQYEVLHPFKDANGRTFANNLLNILLMQHGLPPATFYEPNVFDLYSAEELVDVIKEAMLNTMTIIESHEKAISLYGYHSTFEDRAQFTAMLDSPAYGEIRGTSFPEQVIGSAEDNLQESISSLSKKYPLHSAAVYLAEEDLIAVMIAKNPDQINKRIEQGAPPLYVGRTPIHLAIMMHNSAMIDQLLEAGADLSIRDYNGKTALHYAAEYGNMKIMGKVLSALMSHKDAIEILNIKDNQGKTAFHYAAEFGSPEVVASLTITNLVRVNELDNQGSSAVTIAYKSNKLTTFDTLLNPEVDISNELLMEIVNRKDIDSFKKIVERNPKILASRDAFEVAVRLGSIGLVRAFLQAGMHIDTPLNEDNATALMVAVNGGDVRLARYLLKKGADTTLTDVHGSTCLHSVLYAAPKHRVAMAKMLLDKDRTLVNRFAKDVPPPIFVAITLKDYGVASMLLEMGSRVTYNNYEENNLLHRAMDAWCDMPMLEKIIEIDSGMLSQLNIEGRNPFHQGLYNRAISTYPSRAEENQFVQLANYLLDEGVDLNTKDRTGKTILDIALSRQYCHLGVKLMQAGAQTNISLPTRFLKHADANDILEHLQAFQDELNGKLDQNPLIAMGQLNDLYIKIRANAIRTPTGFMPDNRSFFKGKSADQKAHDSVLTVLKRLYDSKLHNVLDSHYGASRGELQEKSDSFNQNLRVLINNQEISKKIDKPTKQLVEGESHRIRWK